MFAVVALSALLLGASAPSAPAQVQAQPQARPDSAATVVPDVEVYARPTPDAVRDFVGRVAAPPHGRGLARWRGKVCPGVANLDAATAQAIIDRITLAAADLDLTTGDPGCNPNLVIVFTVDGAGLAQAMVARDRDIFRNNVSGNERGAAAFRDFQMADRPVRWWSLSLPVDSQTGQRAVRAPGDMMGGPIDDTTAAVLGCSAADCGPLGAPMIMSTGASRINSQIVDSLYKTIIIVDIDRIGGVNTVQLGDYLALIGLAQIDDQADTAGFDTVLNLFSGGGQDGLTDWDRSYLAALYGPRSQRVSPGAQASAVASIMTRDRMARGREE